MINCKLERKRGLVLRPEAEADALEAFSTQPEAE